MTGTVMLPPIDARPEEIARPLFPPCPAQAETLVRAREERNAAWVDNPLIFRDG